MVVTDILGGNDDSLSLPALVAATARRASDMQLAIYVIAGVAIVTAALFFRPTVWHLFAAFGVSVGSFGCIGIADRELLDHVQRRAIARFGWRTLRLGASFAAGAAALFFLFAVLAILVGTWKS